MKQRLDKILTEIYPDLSRADIKRLIENQAVFISGRSAVKPSEKIEQAELIKIDKDKLAEIKELQKIDLNPDVNIKFDVIYEDDDIAIIEKPAGLVVHPAYSHKSKTLVNGLLARWPQIADVGDDLTRPGIVHRLDKDVSGIMAVAKSQNGFQSLKKQFQRRAIKKTYIAIVYGKPLVGSGVITGAITRSKYKPTKQIISESGKEAITEYRVIENRGDKSLIECYPLTGRMHQIRVHLSSIGCPIVGDKKYLPKNLLKIDTANRIMLHAKSLKIDLISGEKRKFKSKSTLDYYI